MTDPKGSENQSEELSLDQLEGVAGGILAQANAAPNVTGKPSRNKFMTNTFLKNNISGSASPGGDDV